MSDTILPSIHYTSGGNTVFDTMPLQPVESHVNGLPDTGESQFFDEDAVTAITNFADYDPLIQGSKWVIKLEHEGGTSYYQMLSDREPHNPHVHGTFVLGIPKTQCS